jgi:ubiquinone/menaquinone biosynthesis C-methylase UbiE
MASRAEMFNRRASSSKSNPEGVLEKLALKQGQIIADVGSGGGFFTLRFAGLVGANGKVYAVDTNPDFLKYIEKSAKEKGISNVVTVLAKDDGFELPADSLDLIFIRNVTHHLPNRISYFRRMKGLLRSGGRVAIIEYKPGGGFSFRRLFGHFIRKEDLIREMKEAGYGQYHDFDLLQEQSFLIFSI